MQCSCDALLLSTQSDWIGRKIFHRSLWVHSVRFTLKTGSAIDSFDRSMRSSFFPSFCKRAVTTAQKRWKSLRDTFVKKRREAPPAPSGSSPSKAVEVRWPHYKQMKFLEDTLDYPEYVTIHFFHCFHYCYKLRSLKCWFYFWCNETSNFLSQGTEHFVISGTNQWM